MYSKLRNSVNICQTVNQKANELHGLLLQYIIFNSSVYYLAVEPNEWKREKEKKKKERRAMNANVTLRKPKNNEDLYSLIL